MDIHQLPVVAYLSSGGWKRVHQQPPPAPMALGWKLFSNMRKLEGMIYLSFLLLSDSAFTLSAWIQPSLFVHITDAITCSHSCSPSILIVHTMMHLNNPLHLTMISCCVLGWCSVCLMPAEPRSAATEITETLLLLWLLGSDRGRAVTRRGTTIRFVDCPLLWHVEIIEANALTWPVRQLLWSYIFWQIPSMTYYWRTRKSVWSLLALYSSQLRDASRGISSSEGLAPNVEILVGMSST